MAPPQDSREVERRALALFERLVEHPDDDRYRGRLLRREDTRVLARLGALEAGGRKAARALPTQRPDIETEAAAAPDSVGPFRLVRRIGAGGMGDVWLGERSDGLYQQEVAIKLILRKAATGLKAAFDDERRFLARLEHPNIARLIDGGVAQGDLPYLVMEFVDGTPINEACQGLPLRARIAIFGKAAEAVQFAHGRMVAHADLKPGNILVDRSGQVKLIDFGIAGLIDRGAQPGARPGPLTQGFASPARLAGAGPSVGDDVFALGKTLAMVLLGTADPELTAITAKACAEDERARYLSVSALLADLERWRDQAPVTAVPASTAYNLRKFFQRHRQGVLASVAALIVLATMTGLAAVSYLRAQTAKAEATARANDARSASHFMLFGLMDQLEVKPKSLALRVQVAAEAQHYLDRIAAMPGAAPAVRLEAATGLWRLAEYQAKPGRPSLRQPEAAAANLTRAAAIAAGVDTVGGHTLLAQVLIDRALLAASVEGDTPAAERYLSQGGKALAGIPTPSTDLWRTYRFVEASVRGWQGRYAEEKAAGQAGLALPALKEVKAEALSTAELLDLVAEGEFYLGDLSAAEGHYRQVIATLQAAHDRWPEDNFILGRLARSRWNLGSTLEESKRFAEALPILARGSQEARQALAFEPSDEETVRMLRINQQAEAQTLSFLGHFDEAEPILRLNQTTTLNAWQAHPTDTSRLRDYLMTTMFFGEAQAAAGKFVEGCGTDAEALSLIDRLQAQGRLTGLDVSNNLKLLQQRHAAHCKR